MNQKILARLRRSKKTRAIIKSQKNMNRLTITRTSRHIYAQIIIEDIKGSRVIAAASTLDGEFKNKNTGNVESAKRVGVLIAERAMACNIEKIGFDRSGYKYHGRVKALADAARNSGLNF